jgi:hypothetical protein
MQDPCRYVHPIWTESSTGEEHRRRPLHHGYGGEQLSAVPHTEIAVAIRLFVHRHSGMKHDDCGCRDALTWCHGFVERLLCASHRSDSSPVPSVLVALQSLHCVPIEMPPCAGDRHFWPG